MRIFHVITLSSVGGAQSFVVNLANAQVESNDVWVISSASGEAWKALKPEVKVIKISELRRSIGWRDIIVLFKLFYYRFKYRPDIVHLHSSKIGALGRMVFPTQKVVYTVHGFDSVRIANRSFLFVEKVLKSLCAKIVGVSMYDVKNLQAEGISTNVACVYNGIEDCLLEREGNMDKSAKEQLVQIRNTYEKVIMCIARDDAPKRIDLFIKVAELLPQYAFVWVGNLKEYQHSENVYLMGQIPLAWQLLKFADLFILMSDFEGLPMSIIEALSFGKPVVASKVGGITELLEGECGFAVNNDVHEFEENILKIFQNEENYKQLALNARKVYLERFTIEHMIKGYNNIYQEIKK